MTVEYPAVPLARYAARIGYRDCAFFGIQNENNPSYACREIWTLAQRQDIEFYLLQAQAQIEDVAGFPLVPKWTTAERHAAKRLIMAKQCRVIAMGVISDTKIGDSIAPDYSADPAVITLAGVTCTLGDIHLMFEDTDQEITPLTKTLSGTTLTMTVPWCRLVAPAYQDNPATGWDYADAATWRAPRVDIRCLANNSATQVALGGPSCSTACTLDSGTTCAIIRDGRLGMLELRTTACGNWEWCDLYYRAGLQEATRLAEDAVIRLAHASMPTEPCGCAVTQRLWQRDRNVPDVLTRERVNCRFGLMDGAWQAWLYANDLKIVRGGLLS